MSGQSDRKDKYGIFSTLLPGIFASVVIGLLSGWLTGASGPDSTVVAAIIPAILSLGAGLVIIKGAKDRPGPYNVFLASYIVVFCLVFWLSLVSGVQERRN